MSDEDLRRTPLAEEHRRVGGRMVPFAGWEMPVQYSGVIEEHRAVRSAAGLFDVSHMGEFRVEGPGAERFLQQLTPNDIAALAPGRAHYSALLTREGTYIDDVLVYRRAADRFLVVVNAANIVDDFAWIDGQPHADCAVEDVSDQFALLALQGPKAVEILAPLTTVELGALRYYRFADGEVCGRQAMVSRTGYTGEDGFELYVAPTDVVAIWSSLLERGGPLGLTPAGLGARDTLRLEAGMALYGHEIDRTTTPFDAGLDWVVKLDKGEFIGRQALLSARQRGPDRGLVGLEMVGRGIAREGYPLRHGGEVVGRVTSGTFSPTFEKALAMGYLPPSLTVAGSEIAVEIRGREVAARIVELPFYKRPRR